MSFYSDFAEYYEAVFPFEREVYAFLRDEAPESLSRVLDIGCGTGDYCGEFAGEGAEAMGVDLDPWMIERAAARYPKAEFRVMGMTEIGTLPGGFDLSFCIGNVAAHVSRDAFPPVLSVLGGLLEKGSAWVLQTVNWDFILTRKSHRFPDVRVRDTDVVFERRYSDISPESVMFETRLRSGESVVFEGSVTLCPVRSTEYVRMHREAGFELTGHYGNFGRDAFNADTSSSSVLSFVRTA